MVDTPENLPGWVIWLVIIFAILSICIFILSHKQKLNLLISRVSTVMLFFNSVTTGVIISVYFIYLPIYSGFSGYIDNTQRLLYIIFSNIFSGLFIQNRIIGVGTVNKIMALHGRLNTFFNINIIFIESIFN